MSSEATHLPEMTLRNKNGFETARKNQYYRYTNKYTLAYMTTMVSSFLV
jgi:hypothetical protein